MCLSSSRHVYVLFSLIFTYVSFYLNLSFPVFFHSSVLMHPVRVSDTKTKLIDVALSHGFPRSIDGTGNDD